jgi:SAM-dependent methyltransferase
MTETQTEWQDKMFKDYSDEFVEILAARPIPPAARSFLAAQIGAAAGPALDLGCGSGRFLPVLSALSPMVVGLDYSPALVRHAGRSAAGLSNVLVVHHDMHLLRELFVADSFSFILKVYTSLGYFNYEQELAILQQCRQIARPGCVLIVDTFNAEWIRTVGSFERLTQLSSFTLHEAYRWEVEQRSIVCRWTYRWRDRSHEIDFRLEGYDLQRIDALLHAAGWHRRGLFSDYALDSITDGGAAAERLVVTASRL